MLLIAKLRIRSSWCGCSSGDEPGRITSACRVVSLSHRSTAIIASSSGSTSSSLWPAGVDSTGLPATVISALIWPSPGVAISSARQDTGTWPKHLLGAADAGAEAAELRRAVLEARYRLDRDRPCRRPREHAAALDVEVAGQDVDDVDQPAGQAAELLVARADSPVHHRFRRRRQLTRQRADALGVDVGDCRPPAPVTTRQRPPASAPARRCEARDRRG